MLSNDSPFCFQKVQKTILVIVGCLVSFSKSGEVLRDRDHRVFLGNPAYFINFENFVIFNCPVSNTQNLATQNLWSQFELGSDGQASMHFSVNLYVGEVSQSITSSS
jgi:hypothetical protein